MVEIKLVHVPGQKPIRILKWLVKKGDRIKHGTPLAVYRVVEEPSKQTKAKETQLKSKHVGTVKMFLMQEGQVAIPEGVLLEIEGCAHPVVMKDLCAECGQDLRPTDEANSKRTKQKAHSATVSMIPSIPELKISAEQAEQIAQQDKNRLHQMRKLVLLVDLDQTLIHTTQDPGLAALYQNSDDFYSFQLGRNDPALFTKLRPHCREFLHEISQRYELQIVTFGSRQYAHKIADFIDKEKKHFAHRILSRDECIHPFKKSGNLRHLFPCGDSMVCIIDDRDDVWNAVPNLIVVKKYTYFQGTGDINNPHKLKAKGGQNVGPKSTPTPENVQQSNRKRKSEDDTSGNGLTSDSKRLKDDKATDDGSGNTEQVQCLDSNENQIKSSEDQDKIDDDLNMSSDSDSSSDSSDDSSTSDSNSDDEASRTAENNMNETKSEKDVQVIPPQNQGDKAEETSLQPVASSKTHPNGVNSAKPSSTTDGGVEKTLNGSKMDTDNEGTTSSADTVQLSSSQESEIREQNSQEKYDREISGFSGPSQEFTAEISSQDSAGDNGKKIEDSDDYLHYLKDILSQIHDTYYEAYDKYLKKEFTDLPDVRGVVPFLRSKVLYGCHIVFTGIIPTTFHLPAHMHRAHVTARQLGAKVDEQVTDQTTHLVAAKKGTTKHQDALKRKKQNIKMVSIDWLWCCSERWDKVDERLFPIPDKYIETAKLETTKSTPMEIDEPEKIVDPRPAEPPSANTYDPVTGKLVKKVQDPRFSFMVAESQQRRQDERRQAPLYSSLQVPNAVVPVPVGNPKNSEKLTKTHPSSWKHNPLTKSNTAPGYTTGKRTRKRSMAEIVGYGYSLSTDDIADMDKEVDDLLGSDDEDEEKDQSPSDEVNVALIGADSKPSTSKDSIQKRGKEELGTVIEEDSRDSPATHLEQVKEEKDSSGDEDGEESSEDDEMEALLNAEMHYDSEDEEIEEV